MDDNFEKLVVNRLDSIDDSLREHMRRTDILEELHRDNQKRIELLEEPSKARKYLMNVSGDIIKLSSAGAVIIGILRYLGKI